jgi:membrane protease YdiL (CAAX protease family)
VMFGIMAGVIAQRVGRIGPAICFHAGFNLATVISLSLR